MNKDNIKIIGRRQISREEALFFNLSEVEGLYDTFDKDFSIWSDFDSWKNIGAQQWIFSRAIDVYGGKKIDIKCECCESIYLTKSDLKITPNQKCYGVKSAYMIQKVLEEIILAKVRREHDGIYSA